MTQPSLILIAIGDPNGIGPEIAVEAARLMHLADNRLVLVGDRHVIAHYKGAMTLRCVDVTELPPASFGVLDVLDVEGIGGGDFEPGNCCAASGGATVAYLEAAMNAARSSKVHAIVGCPHNETAVHAAGIPFSGYPSLIARLAHLPEDRVFLMLVGGGLRIVHATLHESVSAALARIDCELVVAAGLAAQSAMHQLGIARPRIGLFGINPHAGEHGLFGNDDERITEPAAARLRALGVDLTGPRGADLLLSQGECDAYVAMFHDQGHIPVKLLSGRRISALSVGAPILFSSVGHGSAADIAGRGLADPSPLLATLKLVAGLGTEELQASTA